MAPILTRCIKRLEGTLVGEPKRFAKPFSFEDAFPAPVAFPNRLLVGLAGSEVTFFDTDTFTKTGASRFVSNATVAGGIRHMYFLVRWGNLVAVDSNGAVWKQKNLNNGSVAFPALSANHVHVATTAGLQTFSLDLEQSSSIRLGGASAGYSSPALGADGEIYAVFGAYQQPSTSALYAFLP